MADFWTTDWLNQSPLFAPLRVLGAGLPQIGWPDTELLNALADEAGRVVNAQGQRVRFVAQAPRSGDWRETFEARAFLKGEVQVRPFSWHDLFNALVWMTFPTAKAVINARHYESLSGLAAAAPADRRPDRPAGPAQRPPVRDALTLFDEDGVVVASSDPELLQLIRDFRWKELFWQRRAQVRQRMRFVVFGHALYHKAMQPFVGMTGKAVLLDVDADFLELAPQLQRARLDRLLAAHAWDRARMTHGRELAPLPVLGIPGWHADNEQENFYDNAAYFRPGRMAPEARAQPGESSV